MHRNTLVCLLTRRWYLLIGFEKHLHLESGIEIGVPDGRGKIKRSILERNMQLLSHIRYLFFLYILTELLMSLTTLLVMYK